MTAEFRHPQANRELRLQSALVAYTLVRARRRSIGFVVSADGLAVRAPMGTTLAAIEAALHSKADWIVRKLAQSQARQQRQAHARIDWCDGAVLAYLGAPLQLRLDASAPLAGALQPGGASATLLMGLPCHASAAQLRDAV